jgi:hypothetical protein
VSGVGGGGGKGRGARVDGGQRGLCGLADLGSAVDGQREQLLKQGQRGSALTPRSALLGLHDHTHALHQLFPRRRTNVSPLTDRTRRTLKGEKAGVPGGWQRSG